jgi:hypothetical protein
VGAVALLVKPLDGYMPVYLKASGAPVPNLVRLVKAWSLFSAIEMGYSFRT